MPFGAPDPLSLPPYKQALAFCNEVDAFLLRPEHKGNRIAHLDCIDLLNNYQQRAEMMMAQVTVGDDEALVAMWRSHRQGMKLVRWMHAQVFGLCFGVRCHPAQWKPEFN